MEENIKLVNLDMKYAHSYWKCFCGVLAEQKYFTFTEGFPLDETIEFLQNTYNYGVPFIMVIDEKADKVIGWCDVQMQNEKIGMLGMGIHADYRGKGIGKKLITTAINKAREYHFEKIYLRARDTNIRAINLYKQMGFKETNLIECDFPKDENYFNILEMELIL